MKLHIKGTTYGGVPAGRIGDGIDASKSPTSTQTREVWYRVVGRETLLETLSRMLNHRWHVDHAYISDADYQQLDDLQVSVDRRGATDSALATYALYGAN